jgi:hypothetical protein
LVLRDHIVADSVSGDPVADADNYLKAVDVVERFC